MYGERIFRPVLAVARHEAGFPASVVFDEIVVRRFVGIIKAQVHQGRDLIVESDPVRNWIP